MSEPFYKPKPIEPAKSWIARLLRWSLGVSVAGWATYGLFAFAFADLGVIPAWIQSATVIAGSALIVIGAEANTVPCCVSALSKVGTPRIGWMDYAAFIASVGGTLSSVLITFSSRQVELDGTMWRAFSLSWGPLVLGITTALDFYGSALELALTKRDYEQAMAVWLEEKAAWDIEHGNVPAPELQPAGIDDFRRVLGRLNGQRATLTAEQLAEELERDGLEIPSKSTGGRWVRMAHKEAK